MRKLHFLNSDGYHIKPANMPSLFGFMKEYGVQANTAPKIPELERCFGDYRDKGSVLDNALALVSELDREQLWNYTFIGKKIFPLIYRELLSFGIKYLTWPDEYIKNDLRFLFDFFHDNAKTDLLSNYAAGIVWLRHWQEYFRNRRSFTHCLIYSGSDIKSATLLEFIRIYGARPVVMETSYTGAHYYMEQVYESIPNRSELRFSNFYHARLNERSTSHRERKNVGTICGSINSVFSRLNSMCERERVDFDATKQTLLILGQVYDDYSIINSGMDNMSSISFYKQAITKFMTQTDFNIVFKAHPWEREKLSTKHLKSTYEHIVEHCENTFSDQMDRIAIVEKYPLSKIFRKADWALAINSQSVLEAAFAGFKGIVFGNPFYGGKGFTWDCHDIDLCIRGIKEGEIHNKLTVKEFEMFETFMVAFFRHLMPKPRMYYDEIWSRLPECDEETVEYYKALRTGNLQNKKNSHPTLATPSFASRFRNALKLLKKDPYGYLGNNRRRYLHPFRYLFFLSKTK